VIRRISFTRRAAGVSYEDFQRHWRGPHAELARFLPDLRSYVQNHAVLGPDGPLLPYPGFDVCVELQYDSRQDMDASLASPQYRGAAVAFTTSAAAQRARWELGGLAAGLERLVARGLRII
jgi:uncharacterized protein (TIGR02118 family)